MQAEPVALVLCSEKIREDAERTLAWFREQGVRCRVISGDNPVTVGAIARRVKLTGDHEPVAMDARELPEDVNELARVLENVDVLGRVLPDQKKAIVQALHTQNHVVAMTGDGVNDALAIKEADLGIAMGNAAPATKAVAQVVLVDSKFSHLPERCGAGPSGHGQYGARGQPVPRQNRVLRADLARRSADANPIPIPAAPYHVYRRSHHRHARVHLALAPNTRRYIPGSSSAWSRSRCRAASPPRCRCCWLHGPCRTSWAGDVVNNDADLSALWRATSAIILFLMGVFVLARVARPLNSGEVRWSRGSRRPASSARSSRSWRTSSR